MTIIAEPDDTVTLAAELTGPLFLPGSAEFDGEVAAFNAAIAHQPRFVVGAANASDVQAAMRYATAHDLPVGVQATGHGACEAIPDGVLISTRRMDTVDIDPIRRTVTVGAGVRWRAVMQQASKYGLAPLCGSSSDVSAVGFTVGGGLPVAGRTFGFAADRVESFDLVTPDGRLRHVDATTEPELHWGLCGGKGNLGIVTSMTIGLVELRDIYGGGLFYAAPHIATVLHAYSDWVASLPDEMSTSVAIMRFPPIPDIPEPLRGQTLAHVRVCYVGDAETGEALVAPIRSAAPALIDMVGEMPYSLLDSIHQDPDHPVPFYERGMLLSELGQETVDALIGAVGPDVRTPLLMCELRHLGGALRRPPTAGNAVGGRDAAFTVLALSLLMPELGSAAVGAVDAVIDALEPWSTGFTMVNLHGAIGNEIDRGRAWDAPTTARLRQLVNQLDPSGLLRFGHAIVR